MEKINIAELLKDCPKDMELDCTMFEDVHFDYIDNVSDIINCYIQDLKHKTGIAFNKYGHYSSITKSKCVIFPKGKTTWKGFQRPFVEGDIVFYNNTIAIFKEWGDETLFRFYVIKYLYKDCDTIMRDVPLFGKGVRKEIRFATEEEKAQLFKSIENNGYRWNPETKTLEKLPKFKVGDVIVDIYKKHLHCDSGSGKISQITDDKYIFTDGSCIHIQNQDNWELVPNKFDFNTLVPFESKVLVRNNENQRWLPAFWGYKVVDGFITTFGWCKYCVPYKGNEALFKTNNDCDKFFKVWEE